jgi:hypothetical protein
MLPVAQIIRPTQNPAERNYPKSLTILINTRIRGYPKIVYTPSMSVPGIKSDTVYFDPLVKLNNSVAKKIPTGYPPSERFTQFYNRGGFESLLNRTISSYFMGTKSITLEKATQEGNVDNNIQVTLNQLFSPGSMFYIKGQPYTIYNYEWNSGDWQIGTKNIEVKFAGIPYGYGMNKIMEIQYAQEDATIANKELEEFKKLYPQSVIQGSANPNSSKFQDGSLLLNQTKNISTTPTQVISKTPPNVQTDQALQSLLPSGLVELLGKEYVEESALNLDAKTITLHSNPISLSLIYYLDRTYSSEIQKNPTLKTYYDSFIKSSKIYKMNSDKFNIDIGMENNADISTQDKKSQSDELRVKLLKNKESILNLLTPYIQVGSRKNYFPKIYNDLSNIEQMITRHTARRGGGGRGDSQVVRGGDATSDKIIDELKKSTILYVENKLTNSKYIYDSAAMSSYIIGLMEKGDTIDNRGKEFLFRILFLSKEICINWYESNNTQNINNFITNINNFTRLNNEEGVRFFNRWRKYIANYTSEFLNKDENRINTDTLLQLKIILELLSFGMITEYNNIYQYTLTNGGFSESNIREIFQGKKSAQQLIINGIFDNVTPIMVAANDQPSIGKQSQHDEPRVSSGNTPISRTSSSSSSSSTSNTHPPPPFPHNKNSNAFSNLPVATPVFNSIPTTQDTNQITRLDRDATPKDVVNNIKIMMRSIKYLSKALTSNIKQNNTNSTNKTENSTEHIGLRGGGENDAKQILLKQKNISASINQFIETITSIKENIYTLSEIITYRIRDFTQDELIQLTIELQQFRIDIESIEKNILTLNKDLIDEKYTELIVDNKNNSVFVINSETNNLYNKIYDFIKKYKNEGYTFENIISNREIKQNLLDTFNKLIILKKSFLTSCKDTLKTFLAKIEAQDNYIKSFVELYSKLKSIKQSEYDETSKSKASPLRKLRSYLSYYIIGFDLMCYTSLLNDASYLSQKTQMINEINNVISSLNKQILIPHNLNEELKLYYNNSALLLIEKYQNNIYSNKILLYQNLNESEMWSLLSKNTTRLFETFKKNTFEQLHLAYLITKQYNETYKLVERNAFLIRLKSSNSTIQNSNLLSFMSAMTAREKQQRVLYFKMINRQMVCYEYISLYAKFHSIELGRKISYTTIVKNIINIEKNIAEEFDSYYRLIKKNLATINGIIPLSVFWKIDSMDLIIDRNIAENNDSYKNSIFNVFQIEEDIKNMESEFIDATNLLVPQLSKMGIMNTCYSISDAEVDAMSENNTFLTNDNIENRFFIDFINQKDKDETDVCQNQFMTVLKEEIRDGSQQTMSVEEITDFLQYWNVYWNRSTNSDSLFYTIATALNGQLILTQRFTLNPYVENPIVDKARLGDVNNSKFTSASLRRCVSENIIDADLLLNKRKAVRIIEQIAYVYNEYITDTAAVNALKLYQDKLKLIGKRWRSIRFLFNENYPTVVSHIRDAINNNTYPSNYSLADPLNLFTSLNTIKIRILDPNYYDGDEMAIGILENVFLIKVVTINTHQTNEEGEVDIGDSFIFRKQTNQGDAEELEQGYVRDYNEDTREIQLSAFNYQQYNFNLDTNRLLSLEEPCYNISPYELNIEVQNKTDRADIEWNYLFLLRNTKTPDNYIYKNLYNFKERKFLYKVDEIPLFLCHLIGRKYFYNYNNYQGLGIRVFYLSQPSMSPIMNKLYTDYLRSLNKYTQTHAPIRLDENLNDLTIAEKRLLLSSTILGGGGIGMQMGGMQMGQAYAGGQGNLDRNFIRVDRRSNIYTNNSNDSRLSYYVVIDLELYPGKDGIPLGQKLVLNCQTKYEKIRQVWAKLWGIAYRPTEAFFVDHTVKSSAATSKKNKNYKKSHRNKTHRRL